MGKENIILYYSRIQSSISFPETLTLEKNIDGFIVSQDYLIGNLFYDELLTKKAGTYSYKVDYIQNMNQITDLEFFIINIKNVKDEYGTAWFTMPVRDISPGAYYKDGDIIVSRSFSSTGTFKCKPVKLKLIILPNGLRKIILNF